MELTSLELSVQYLDNTENILGMNHMSISETSLPSCLTGLEDKDLTDKSTRLIFEDAKNALRSMKAPPLSKREQKPYKGIITEDSIHPDKKIFASHEDYCSYKEAFELFSGSSEDRRTSSEEQALLT